MITSAVYNNYFNNLIKGARKECAAIVDELISKNVTVDIIYTQLFQHSLYQVGEYWEMNRISVATEHMATAITENLMIGLQPQIFARERVGRKVVISCLANEYHQVGAKMIADIFEMNGWDGYFVGANTPTAELIRFIELHKPDLLGLSLSIYFNLPVLKTTVVQIRKHFNEMPILLGGQAFRLGGTDIVRQFHNLMYIADIDMLNDYIGKNSYNEYNKYKTS